MDSVFEIGIPDTSNFIQHTMEYDHIHPIFSLSRFSRNTVANSLYSHQEETINYRYYRYKDLQLPDRVAPNVANERGQ